MSSSSRELVDMEGEKMNQKQICQKKAIEKELKWIAKQENKLQKIALKEPQANSLKEQLESKIPEKVRTTLELTFCRAFAIVFEKGVGVIEKSYNKESIEQDYEIHDYAVKLKGNRQTLKKMKKSATNAGLGNMAITTVEGIGLGILGIGMPDIVIFVGVLLKGIYEMALHYGFAYDTPEERMLILKMMETAMTKGEAWIEKDAEIEKMLALGVEVNVNHKELEIQEQQTASAFAMDMLLLKFIQGFPIVGMIGGASNPVYYNKVIRYVKLKYQKRYLLNKYRDC